MSDLVVSVEIAHSEAKIGDTLCVLPLIMQLADIFATNVHVTGAFSEPVKKLAQTLPIRFGRPDDQVLFNVFVDIQTAYGQGWSLNQHMAASICRLAGWPLPVLPVALDLTSTSSALPSGILLSPFSGSKNPWYKAWPLDRWLSLARHLVSSGGEPVYVAGGASENALPFADLGAIPLIGLTLSQILHVMREARVFVSIDNGLSHLAHFGGVERHLLIYPELLPPRLVVNPRARVLRGQPEHIEVARVIDHIDDIMRGRSPNRVVGNVASLLELD